MGMKEFFMPRGKGDRAIADVARIFAKLPEPVKTEFIANHMSEDFIDRFEGRCGGHRTFHRAAGRKLIRTHAARRVEKAAVLKKSPEKQGTLSPSVPPPSSPPVTVAGATTA